MLKKLMIVALAGFLFVGASNAMARVIGGWFVLAVESTDENITLETLGSELCVGASATLRGMGYRFRDSVSIEPRIAALYFLSTTSTDVVTLFCLANIIEEQSELFD